MGKNSLHPKNVQGPQSVGRKRALTTRMLTQNGASGSEFGKEGGLGGCKGFGETAPGPPKSASSPGSTLEATILQVQNPRKQHSNAKPLRANVGQLFERPRPVVDLHQEAGLGRTKSRTPETASAKKAEQRSRPRVDIRASGAHFRPALRTTTSGRPC